MFVLLVNKNTGAVYYDKPKYRKTLILYLCKKRRKKKKASLWIQTGIWMRVHYKRLRITETKIEDTKDITDTEQHSTLTGSRLK